MADAAESSLTDDEDSRVRRNRTLEALEAGLSMEEAAIFAVNGVDVGQLRACVKAGRTAEEIAAIVV